jgi:hypothetical protein
LTFVADRPIGDQLPGDCNQDGALDLPDVMCLLFYLFPTEPPTLPCGNGRADDPGNVEIIDFNDDSGVDIADAVSLLMRLFLRGPTHTLVESCRTIANCSPV